MDFISHPTLGTAKLSDEQRRVLIGHALHSDIAKPVTLPKLPDYTPPAFMLDGGK
jgi:hypothetical protein